MSADIQPMTTRPLGNLKLVQNDNILFALLQIVELHGAHLDQGHGKSTDAWDKVSDNFYSPGMIGALYKRQSRSASLKKTVLGAIQHRARMVTAPGAHSNKVQEAHEDISEVDELCVKLWHEHEAEKDRIEAIRLEKACLKARRQAVSNALVPPPTVPPLPTHLMEIHSEAVQGRLAASTANVSGREISNISPHPDQNGVIEAFVGATRNPLSNLNGALNGSVSHATPASKKVRRSLASEDARELLDDRQSKSAAAVDAFMAEINSTDIPLTSRKQGIIGCKSVAKKPAPTL